MIRTVEDANLYIAIIGRKSELNDQVESKINSVFSEAFDDLASNVSNITVDHEVELIYEVKMPIMKNEVIMADHFERLRYVFSQLEDYRPHFTQLKKGSAQ